MFSKVFALFVVALVAFQAVNAEFVGNEEALGAERGLLDTVKKAIQGLLDLIKENVNKVTDTVQGLLNQVMDTAKDIVAKAGKTIADAQLPIITQINDLLQNALNQGLDGNKCVGNHLTEIANIPIDATKKILDCTQVEIDFVNKLCNEAIDQINETFNTAAQLLNELDKCGKLNILCLTGVLTKVTAEVAKVPLKAAAAIAHVTGQLAGVQVKLAKCAATEVANAAAQTVKTGGSVISCLTNLLNGAL